MEELNLSKEAIKLNKGLTPEERVATVETLRNAKALIEDDGHWIQGDLKQKLPDGTFAFCAWGAIREADGPGERFAKKFLARVAQALYQVKYPWAPLQGSNYRKVYSFNDAGSAIERRQQHREVIGAFDKAIEMVNVDKEGS